MWGSWCARSLWSTRIPAPVESPQPSASSVRGRTPQERTRRSPSIAEPSSSSRAEKPPSGALCSTPMERALPATRTPQFRSEAASTAPPPRSMFRPSGCGPLCTTVTVAPSSAAARAVSRPSTPPPRTTTRLPPATAECSTDASRRSRRAVTPGGSDRGGRVRVEPGEVRDDRPGTGGEDQPVVAGRGAVGEDNLLAGAVHAADADAQPDVDAVGHQRGRVREGQGGLRGPADAEIRHQARGCTRPRTLRRSPSGARCRCARPAATRRSAARRRARSPPPQSAQS